MATQKRQVAGQSESLRLANRLALYYGLASIVFSILVHLHAGNRAFDPGNAATAGAFGLFRGWVIGFFVAYVFLEFGRVHQQSDRRLRERVHMGRKLILACGGAQVPAYLKNLSDSGALVKVFSRTLAVGDELILTLGRNRSSKGVVQWVQGNLAGLRFETDGRSRVQTV